MSRLASFHSITLIIVLIALTFAIRLPIGHTAGTVNPCTEASLDAALAGGGNVTFGCSGTITVTTTKTIAANTTLDGSGQSVTISGGGTVGVFLVSAGVTLDIVNLTITNGNAIGTVGGGVFNNGGTLNISNSTFSGNTATTGGGAVSNNSILNISNSTFSGNSTFGVGGGNGAAIYTGAGPVNITNSTFSGNSANNGGAIFNNGSMLTISNSTFSGNSATVGGNLYRNTGTTSVNTSILDNGSCSGAITDGGNNIAFNAAGCPGANADPLLGALGNYGGATQTFPLQAGSPALDTFSAGCPATDQRGIVRPQGAACDSGAYEAIVTLSPSGTPIVVVPTQPAPDQCQEMLDASFSMPIGWYCQVLMRNNAWTGYAGTIPSELTDAGVIIAVDVSYYDFAGHAAQQVDGTHQVCLQGDGRFIFLSNAQAPRQIVELNSVSEGGYTCAWVTTAGTAVLIHN